MILQQIYIKKNSAVTLAAPQYLFVQIKKGAATAFAGFRMPMTVERKTLAQDPMPFRK